MVITAHLKETLSADSALRSNVWKNPDDVKEQVAVVSKEEKFKGIITREQIIDTLLKK